MKRYWFLLVLLTFALPAAAGEMYSWTDANGVKHFSDSPPPTSVKARKVKVKGGLTTNEPVDEAPKADDKNAGPALAAAAGYSAEDIKRNCDIATKNFDTASAQKIPLDANGQPDLEAAQGRQAQIDKAEQQKKLFCRS